MFDASTDRTSETIRFGSLNIRFDDRVLHPRPWTLAQSQWALELIDDLPDGPILELCAGAGQISLAVAALGTRRLVLVDANPTACAYARDNAREAHVEQAEFRTTMIDDALRPEERFALIIADPPWVPSAQTSQFPEDPLMAIDGGLDGLTLVWSCLRLITDHLIEGGVAILQVGGPAQVEEIRKQLDLQSATGLIIEAVREPVGGGVLILLTGARFIR